MKAVAVALFVFASFFLGALLVMFGKLRAARKESDRNGREN